MGLKNKHSLYDLVEGRNVPVEEMENQKGPQFQRTTDVASQVHVDSLQKVPGPPSNSPFQDLEGLPDPNFNTLGGTVDSPFQSTTGDHMVDLLTQTALSTNTNQTYNPAPDQSQYQDLDGQPGPQSQLPTAQASQVHIDSLGIVPGPPSNSTYQDLDGVDGGQGYFHGIPNPGKGQGVQIGGKDLHEHLLTGTYTYTHGLSTENVGPSPGETGNSEFQDLNTTRGNIGDALRFNFGSESPQDKNNPIYDTIHEKSLLAPRKKDLDLNGKPGDRFDTFFPGKEPSQDKNSPVYDTIHEKYLNRFGPIKGGSNDLQISPGRILHLEGQQGTDFAKLPDGKQLKQMDLHKALLKHAYTYTHGNATANILVGENQDGGIFDLDGGTETFSGQIKNPSLGQFGGPYRNTGPREGRY